MGGGLARSPRREAAKAGLTRAAWGPPPSGPTRACSKDGGTGPGERGLCSLVGGRGEQASETRNHDRGRSLLPGLEHCLPGLLRSVQSQSSRWAIRYFSKTQLMMFFHQS